MKTVLRGLAVLGVITTALGATGQPATAEPGDYISIDVVVVGTPPPGASVSVVADHGDSEQSFAVDLATANTDFDVPSFSVDAFQVGWAVYLDPEEDADADEISYTCTIDEPDPSSCQNIIGPNQFIPVKHSYASNLNTSESEQMDFVVTVTFDPPCDGREVTVNNNRGEVPTAGNDVVLGTPFNDGLDGLGGHDVICGGGGRDTITGGPGRDRILGGAGADRINGGDAADTLFGGTGVDTLLGGPAPDVLDGGPQRDTCNGGTQQDTATACEVRTAIP